MQQGLSVPAYCEANGLAKSTFRRYACGARAGMQGADERVQTSAQPTRFVPVRDTAVNAESMMVEIETGNGMKLRLGGAAADRLMQQLLARFA